MNKMITQEDRNILHSVGKKYLLNTAFNSPLIKSRLTFKEHIELCSVIDGLTYPEIIGIVFNEEVRSFEGKFRKFLKYGFAAIAGLAVSSSVVGVVAGPPLAMFILYTYRKLTDTCNRECMNKWPLSTQKKICRYECQIKAAAKVANQIRVEMSRCSGVSSPDACRKKLEKQYIVWSKRVQDLKIKLSKSKLGIEAQRRKENAKAMKDRMRTIQSSFQITKPELVSLIAENSHLRNSIDFKQHLKIYQISKGLTEDEEIVKPFKINPHKEKLVRYALYAGFTAIPIPLLSDAVNYLVKKNNVGCITSCLKQSSYSQKLCRYQCTYLSAQSAIKLLKKELPKCKDAKKPVKCKKKILSMLGDWSQRELEAKLKYKFQKSRENK